jgi:hypothetical protein
VAALTIAAAANAGPDSRLHVRAWQAPFSLSGQFTGTLDGRIQIGLDSYPLSRDVVVYEVGTGPLPAGSVITDRFVFACGTNGKVNLVIVRPAEDSNPSDLEGKTHELSDATPQ